MSDKENLKTATTEYHLVDKDYRNTLFKYSLFILSAELAIIGFLLQNTVTQSLLKITSIKMLFMASIVISALAVISNILYKKYESLYAMHDMHIQQAEHLEGNPVNVLGEMMLFDNVSEIKKKAALEAIRYNKIATTLGGSSEVLLALSGISGATFIILLLINL